MHIVAMSLGFLMSAADTAIVTVRIDTVLKAKLESLARSTKRSRSYLAAEAIAAYVELYEAQISEIEAGLAELDRGQVVSEEQAGELYDRLLKPR
jgi:RHH-type transcriptional regulator, rel operon repressor / antitoxin RelB